MKKVLIILLAVVAAACSKQGVQKPDNLIDEEVMVDIFYDLAIMDAIKSHRPLSLELRNIVPDRYIYKKYAVDSVQFANSNRYYAADIEKYKKIYSKVGERIESFKTEADSIAKKSPAPVQRTPREPKAQKSTSRKLFR